jgi:hypothetical protein
MKDGNPGYVTAIAKTNVGDGWRDHRSNGGVVIDVASGEVVAEGLVTELYHVVVLPGSKPPSMIGLRMTKSNVFCRWSTSA